MHCSVNNDILIIRLFYINVLANYNLICYNIYMDTMDNNNIKKIDHIYFYEPFDKIKSLFLNEGISVKEKFVNSFINMLPGFLHYEEESQKIRPSILLCKDVEELKQIEGIDYNEMSYFDVNEFDKRLKAFITFCINEFTIVFTFKENKIFCGIASYTPCDGAQLEDKLYSIHGFIWITAQNSKSSNPLFIDFSFESTSEEVNDNISLLANAISKQNIDDKMKYKNIFIDVFSRIHGTIIIVVSNKSDNSDLQKTFDDGIWLSCPIKLLDEKTAWLKQVLLSMLNCDGITILNDNGEIIAFNVFITSNTKTNQPGGARKRAFNTLTQNSNVIAAYFQSQDGNSDCKHGGYNE